MPFKWRENNMKLGAKRAKILVTLRIWETLRD
jgi:hypothetical protein